MSTELADITHPGWYLLISFFFAILPILIATTTSYLKFSIALGVLKNGFGAQQVPNSLIIMVLSVTLSLFVMEPTYSAIFKNAQNIKFQTNNFNLEAICQQLKIFEPLKDFMRNQVSDHQLRMVSTLQNKNKNLNAKELAKEKTDEYSFRVLFLAFLLTELKEGLFVGFMLLLPFLVIDLIIANLLAGLGMYMVSPTIISLPLKLLLFVSVDGWVLITRGLINSY